MNCLRLLMCHLQVKLDQLVDSQAHRQADPCWRVVDDEAVHSWHRQSNFWHQ